MLFDQKCCLTINVYHVSSKKQRCHLLCIKLHLSVYNDVTDTVNDVWPLKQNVGQYSYQKSRTSTYKD